MPNKKTLKPGLVYDQLKEDILYLKLKPGELISETETSQRFGVSRTSIRSAFKKLETEGLLQIAPKKGTYVSLISIEAITDTLFMRETLELACINELIQRVDVPIYKINTILEKQYKILQNEDNKDIDDVAREFFKLDNEYHRSLFTLAGKERIWNILNTIDYQYTRFRMFLNVTDLNHLKGLYSTHVDIFNKIVKKDKSSIVDLYHDHIYDGIRLSSKKVSDNSIYFADL